MNKSIDDKDDYSRPRLLNNDEFIVPNDLEWPNYFIGAKIDTEFIDEYVQLMESAEIDMAVLGELDQNYLQMIGITNPSHIRKILNHVEIYQELCKLRAGNPDEIGPYYLSSPLGEGTNHRVYEAVHKITGEHVAVKILRQHLFTPEEECTTWHENPTKHEKRILDIINPHPHIIRAVDAIFHAECIRRRNIRPHAYLTNALVMEIAVTSLLTIIQTSGPLSEPQARYYFHQFISAMKRCHECKVVHRDLKPDQILFSDQMELRLTDFNFGALEGTDSAIKDHVVGTKPYMSPEIYQECSVGPREHNIHNIDSVKADIYGCGVILLWMLTGVDPFNTLDGPSMDIPRYRMFAEEKYNAFWNELLKQANHRQIRLLDRLNSSFQPDGDDDDHVLSRPPMQTNQTTDDSSLPGINFGFSFKLPIDVSDEAKDFIQSMMHHDVDKRITMEQLQNHSWMSGDVPSLNEMFAEMKSRFNCEFEYDCVMTEYGSSTETQKGKNTNNTTNGNTTNNNGNIFSSIFKKYSALSISVVVVAISAIGVFSYMKHNKSKS